MAAPHIQGPGQIQAFFRRLSLPQRLMFGLMTVGVVGAFVLLVTFVNRPTYGTLFSNLASTDASKIVAKLQEKKIPYTIEDEGRTVLIPKDKIYDLRLALAGEGLPQSSVIGYEIFDRTNLGVSDFVQKVNYRRAMEGELARTILQLEEVEGARVHIVVPEKTLFREDEKSATASVILKLKASKPLKRETVQGIVHLIASSIEGLEANNVTVVDSRGILLSDNTKPNSVNALTATQYELQQKVEAHVAQKARDILEGVVGTGNALVQVNVELDFRQVDKTLEQYDPEKTAVRSEQISEEKGRAKDSATPSTRASTVTSFEVNKTIEHIVENVGGIKRLSVAALVNGSHVVVDKGNEKATEYVARKPEELNQLTDLVKRAVGFNAQRNDEVSVINLPFGNNGEREDFIYKDQPLADWPGLLEKIFIVLAMIGGALLLRSLLSRLRVRSVVGTGVFDEEYPVEPHKAQRLPVALVPPEQLISEEAHARIGKRSQIASYIQERPDDASRLLKVWLAES